MRKERKFGALALGLAFLGVLATGIFPASAAVITNGSGIFLGVNTLGHLNVAPAAGEQGVTNSSRVGVAATFPDGTVRDATSPGCFCEGWGVAGNGIAGGGNEAAGSFNLTLSSFGSTASTATSVVTLTTLSTLQVTHRYQPSSDGRLYEGIVTITNTGAAAITDIRYRRVMDWDIPPTELSEFVTIFGAGAANLLDTDTNGFDTSNPLSKSDFGSCGQVAGSATNITDCGPGDIGARFDFGFGTLDPGESETFSIFYGAAANQAGAFAALGEVGAEVFSFGQRNAADRDSQVTYIFAFKGVGGVALPDPTPEDPTCGVPGTPACPVPGPSGVMLIGLAISGFGAVSAWRRRK